MADDIVANPGAGGVTFRALLDSGGTDYWPASVASYVTGGSSGAWTMAPVDITHGMPVQPHTGALWSLGAGSAEIGNIKNSGTFAVQAAQSGNWDIRNLTGTITLPTGASTSAKQPALGTAGTASADVLTVQGITSMTPLLVTLSGANNIATVTSLSQFAGTAIDVNSGNKGNGTLRVVLATDQPALTNKLLVTPDANSAVNIAQINGVTTTMGNGVSGTGVQRVTLASDSTGAVTPVPSVSNGLSYKSFVSANSNNKTSVGAACKVYFISIQNISSAPVYLKMFDKTSGNVTAGTTACDYQYMCPANATAANGAGVVFNFEPGIAHANDLTYLLTTGIGTTDNTSVAANIAVVTIGYK